MKMNLKKKKLEEMMMKTKKKKRIKMRVEIILNQDTIIQ
jgi:hypothetical protein